MIPWIEWDRIALVRALEADERVVPEAIARGVLETTDNPARWRFTPRGVAAYVADQRLRAGGRHGTA